MRNSILIILLLPLALFGQVKQRYPTNVRYIGGNYVNQSPFFNNLLSALNNVKASASLTNPYVFQIDSDTLYISDWDSVYQTGGLSMIDSIETHYSGKIKFYGMYGRDTVTSIQDTVNFVSKSTTQVVSGTKWNTGPHYFKSGYKQYANSEVYGDVTLDFQALAKLKFTSGYLFLPQNAFPDDGNIHMDLTTGDIISYGTGNNDTLASQRWVRDNVESKFDTGLVKTTSNQNIFGIKYLYGTLAVTGTSGRLILGDRVPTTLREISANSAGIYYNDGSGVDTIPSRDWTRSSFMDLAYNQSLTGMKTWNTGGITLSGGSNLLLPSSPTSKALGSLWRVGSSGSGLLSFGYGNGTTELDTIVTWRMFRDSIPSVTNAVLLTTNQTIAGEKTFTGNLKFGLSGSIQFPTVNNELSNGVFGDNTYLYYTKSGVAGNFDTLLSWNAFQSIPVKRSFVPSLNNIYDLGSATYKWNDIYTTNITANNIYTSSIEPAGADTTITLAGGTKALKDASGEVLLYSGAVKTLGTATAPMDSVVTKVVTSSDTTNGLNLWARNTSIGGFLSMDGERLDVYSAGTIGVSYSFTELNPDGAYDITTITNLNAPSGRGGTVIVLVNIAVPIVTFKDGTGNLELAGDFAMGQNDSLTLIYLAGPAKWHELSRSNN